MRKAKRLLATLMALAMLVTMIPVMPTAAEAAVSDHVIQPSDRYEQYPEGITVDLFDYWLAPTENNPDAGTENDGIDKGHALRFGEGDILGSNLINTWTKDASPRTGIVENILSGGYPKLTSSNLGGNGESLSYLFNGNNDEGKQSYLNVGGLLQQDEEGYFYYNSQENFAEYDKTDNAFKLYEDWGVEKGGQSPNGQFFPFNTGDQVFTETDGQLTQKSGVTSISDFINHYFGIHMNTRFQQPEDGVSPWDDKTPVTYSFSGDDDVWIYIDGVLVADLGGIHNATSVEIDFSTGDIVIYHDENNNGTPDTDETVYNTEDSGLPRTLLEAYQDAGEEGTTKWKGTTFDNETYHTMDFFYLERGNTDSNMRLKFNLVTTPESTLEKVDQEGEPVPGAKYELYKTNADYSVAKGATPIATGTTGQDGTFIFEDNDGKTLALSALKGTNYVLREVNVPDGYRSAGDIHLRLEGNSKNEGKLLLSDNEWDTGAYAAAKVRVIADTEKGNDGERYVKGLADASGNQEKYDITQENAKVFAAVFHNDGGVEYGKSVDNYEAIYGDPIDGWHTTEATGIAALKEIAQDMDPDATTQGDAVEGLYQFDFDSTNRFVTDIENLPDDINKYAWMSASGATYTGAYFYTTAATYDQMNDQNTFQLDAEEFLRDFAVTLYAPNIKNKLIVQKIDQETPKQETPKAIEGAEFTLTYESTLEGGQPTKPIGPFTDKTEKSIFVGGREVEGAVAFTELPLGVYKLKETGAPDGYNVNDTDIKVIVDNAGVHVNAGTDTDNVDVTLGVGRIVKSMVQFAVDDGIDASLHDINATLQISDNYNESTQWINTDQSMALSYSTSPEVLEYAPTDPDSNNVGSLSYKEGWGRLNITQNYSQQTPNNSPKQDLKQENGGQDQLLNNLFSGTTIVTVGDAKKTPGNVTITKQVESEVASDKTDTYEVQLTVVGGDFHNGEITVSGSDEPLKFDENHQATLDIKDDQTISLNVPAGVTLQVAEVNPGSSFKVSYTVNGGDSAAPEVMVDQDGNHEIVITNKRTSGGSVDLSTNTKGLIKITKEVTEGDWPDGEDFTFTITGSDGAPMPQANNVDQTELTISKPEDGTDKNINSASFGDITFTQTGTYTYTIKEKSGDVDNMSYDDHELTVTVTVGKDETTGALKIDSVAYDSSVTDDTEEQAKTFTNTIGKDEPDNPGGGGGWIPGGGGNEDTPDLNTEDHFSYIVGYPEDYRTGEKTDDESLWPVKPQGNITRAEVATIFYRLLTDEARTEHWTRSNDYSDVAAESWYNTPVSTLSAMGIVNGYEDGSFRPNAPITRAEFAAIAVRFFENDNVNYEEGLFTDIEGSEWFADAVAAAKEHGIIGGYPDGSFQPNKAITRAEACSIVNRTVDRIPDKDHLLPEDEMRVWPDNSNTNAWYYADMQEATSGHEYTWVNDDNDEPLYEQWTGDLPEVDWEQVEIDQEEKHGLR